MSKKIFALFLVVTVLAFSAVAAFAVQNGSRRNTVGAVFVMTNAAEANQVVVFERDSDGMLTLVGPVTTGGMGSGGGLDPLGSQNSLVLAANHRLLLAVNAGSSEISVFHVLPDGLKLIDIVDSGGEFPVSLAVFHNLVYVLNANSPNITGFTLNNKGELTPLDDSTRSLGPGAFAQVAFDPQGNALVVTDKGDNEILVFSVGQDGLPSTDPVTSPSNGLGPFGFMFDQRGRLLVVEAGSGAVSSYNILSDLTLQTITPSEANGQAATCWIAGNARGDIFTSNTGSGTISAYQLTPGNGTIALKDAEAGLAVNPIDSGVTVDGRFLYALDPGDEAVHMYRIEVGGGLTDLGTVAGGLSIFAQGLAAR